MGKKGHESLGGRGGAGRPVRQLLLPAGLTGEQQEHALADWGKARASLAGHPSWQEHSSCCLPHLCRAKGPIWESWQSPIFYRFLRARISWP